MTTKEASQLLRDYTTGGSDDAFRRLVEGHTGLVEGTARRQLNGDAALVQDVAQTVFATLAKHPQAVRGTSVAAWLHRVTVRRAADAVRGEVRRRHREHAALVCPDSEAVMPEHDDFWTQATPAIDAALDRLPAEDRAILLERFWQRQSLRAIGAGRSLSENAVQKRIARSLERLRGELVRRGIRGSGSLLSVTLGAALVHSGSGAAARAGGTAVTPASSSILTNTILMTAQQKLLTGAAALVLLAVPVYQQTRINALNDEVAALSAAPSNQPRKANSPVLAAIGDQHQPTARTFGPQRDKTKAAAATEPGEIIARVNVTGPGEAVFARRGNSVVLESFRAAGAPAEDGAALTRILDLGAGEAAAALTPAASAMTAGHVQWDHAQATGEPDTPEAGDRPTAWAPRSTKSGEQWIQLGYDQAVEMKEINIHESYNKGAISKVTAFLPDGTEKTLWTGNVAPRPDGVPESGEVQETSVPVPAGITSNQIKVYVDTNRVGSWPEIDAVELVGTNGSHQWASSSSASSSYSENYSNQGTVEYEGRLGIESRTRILGGGNPAPSVPGR